MRGLRQSLLGFGFVLLIATPAVAGSGDGQDSSDGSTTISVELGFEATGGLTPKGKNTLAGCNTVTPLQPNHLLDYLGATGQHLAPFDLNNIPENLQYHFVSCPSNPFAGLGWYVWEIGDPAPPIVINAIARHAYNQTQVPLPTPQTSPDGTLQTPLIVNLETWYWTDQTLWTPISVTAEIPEFGISVTATATPTTSTWNPGDGNPNITCEHGTPWTIGLDENQKPDCSHTYTTITQHDGESEPFALTATTTWEISYTCQPAGYCPVPPNVPGTLTTVIERPVWVTQIKGILVG